MVFVSEKYLEPRQNRSQKTARRIIEATLRLLERKDFEEISVNEIASAARISVGGFYSRFKSKEALLHWFDENLLEQQLTAVRDRFAAERLKNAPLREIIFQYLSPGADFLFKYRSLLTRIVLRLRMNADEEYLARARRFNSEVSAPFLKLLHERKKEIRHPDPASAAQLGLMVVTAALREAILFGDRNLYGLPTGRKKLVEELTTMYLCYLHAS